MKQIKKLISIMLTMAMALAMSVTAFAGDGTVEPGDTAEDTTKVTHTYEIYQIFTGDYADGVLSNIKWGENGTGTKGEKVNDTVLDELEALTDTASDTDKLVAIEKYANLESKAIRTGEGTEYTGLTPGYYLVKDQDGSLDNTNVPYTLYVVKVVNNTLSFNPKGDIPTPEKKIVEDDKRVSANEASIGDEVKYEITGTMPSNIDQYKTYYYLFTDTLSKGLTYKKDSITVKVNNVDVTKYFYKKAEETATGTTIKVGILDVKALSLLETPKVGDITEDTEIVLTYTATLNEDAVIAGDGNPNDVKLTYSNDPNNSGDGSTPPPENPDEPKPTHPVGESPEIEVVTYTTELTILKTNEDEAFLPGVEFTLTGEGVNVVLVTKEVFVESDSGEYWKLKDGTYTKTAPTITDDEEDNSADYESTEQKYEKQTTITAKGNGKTEKDVVGTVQADGTVTFKGLGAGDYTITETKTLPGYNTIEPINFKLTFNEATKTFESDNEKVTVGEDNMLDTSIKNQKGSTLPSTGGIGTTIFYIIGGILVVGAAILLVTKKRMSKEA